MKAGVGDKVRMKAGSHAGARGVVEVIEGEKLTVRLDELEARVRVIPEQVTNYSLAARKAWVTDPNRAVGRRKGTKLYDRVSVTLRIDREIWQRFVALERSGQIDDRTGVINGWFREQISLLEGGEA